MPQRTRSPGAGNLAKIQKSWPEGDRDRRRRIKRDGIRVPCQRWFSFPIAPDADREVFSRFAKDTIPRNYLIRSDGRIAYQSVGYTETLFDELEHAIKRELAQPQ